MSKNEMPDSPEYTAAREAAHAAGRLYHLAQRDYRSRKIGDIEFLKARAEYDKSTVAFDAAYAAEEKLRLSISPAADKNKPEYETPELF